MPVPPPQKRPTNHSFAKISALAHNSERATTLVNGCDLTRRTSAQTTKIRQPQQPSSWVVFTAKERVLAPRLSHTRDPCPPGSRARPRPSSRTSADSPEKAPLLRKSVLSFETAMVSLKSRSSLVSGKSAEGKKNNKGQSWENFA